MLLGRGPQDAAQRLADHLSECPQCAAVAEAISLDSSLVSGLRRDSLPPPPTGRELADVISRVGRIDRSTWGGRANLPGPDIDLPGRLGPYRLIELLGVGGMGVVYRAEDTSLHRLVAVKVVKGGADAETRARFLSEARALAAVRHDNIVTVYFVGEELTAAGAIPYLAMELLDGQTLRDSMATASLPSVEWIIQAGRQIAAGLAFVHDAGMVHRDIKPANLWLESPPAWANRSPQGRPSHNGVGRVKLLDFGLAHQLGPLMEAGAVGTPAYVAPEQARGEVVDARADLFSLGCVLYELCTGKLPFRRQGGLWAGWDSPPTPVRELNPAVPERLANLIERLLAADRADRPESTRAVELELASLDVHHSPGTPTVSGHADATVVARPIQRTTRRPLLAPAIACLLVAGIVLAIAYMNMRATHQEALVPRSTISVEKPKPFTEEPKEPAPTEESEEEWGRRVSTQQPQRQLNEVLRRLGKLNPKFDWLEGSGWVESYGVIRITLNADVISDLGPVQILKTLTVVRCRGSAPGLGILKDLSPFSELKLKELHCRNNPGLTDLSPIQLQSLDFLDASYTGLETLSGLSASPLSTLKIAGTRVTDLSPVRQMSRLRALDCSECAITDFEPLTALSLRDLRAQVRADRDTAVLMRIKTLKYINNVPVKDFWKRLQAGKSESPVATPE